MKNWPISIIFEVAGSTFGRAFLAFFALVIGICITCSIMSGAIFIPDDLIASMGFAAIASLAFPLSAAFLASELVLSVLFIRAERGFWMLACISALAVAHAFYIIKTLEAK